MLLCTNHSSRPLVMFGNTTINPLSPGVDYIAMYHQPLPTVPHDRGTHSYVSSFLFWLPMSRFRGAYASFLLAPVLSAQLHARPRLSSPSLSLHPTPGHPRRCAQLPTHGPEQPDRQSYGTTNRQLRPHYLCHPDRSRPICPWISCCHCSGRSGHRFHQPPRATRNCDVAILDSFTPRWPCQECLTKIARKLSLATRLFFQQEERARSTGDQLLQGSRPTLPGVGAVDSPVH